VIALRGGRLDPRRARIRPIDRPIRGTAQ
jgi:hypothetical protein